MVLNSAQSAHKESHKRLLFPKMYFCIKRNCSYDILRSCNLSKDIDQKDSHEFFFLSESNKWTDLILATPTPLNQESTSQ